MSLSEREMSLDEFCASLPMGHRVNRELRNLKAKAPSAPAGPVRDDDLLEAVQHAEEVLRTVPAYNGLRLFDLFPGLAKAVAARLPQLERDK